MIRSQSQSLSMGLILKKGLQLKVTTCCCFLYCVMSGYRVQYVPVVCTGTRWHRGNKAKLSMDISPANTLIFNFLASRTRIGTGDSANRASYCYDSKLGLLFSPTSMSGYTVSGTCKPPLALWVGISTTLILQLTACCHNLQTYQYREWLLENYVRLHQDDYSRSNYKETALWHPTERKAKVIIQSTSEYRSS